MFLVFLLGFFVNLGYGFKAANYLYPNESLNNLSSENVVYQNEEYVLYYYNDNPMMVVKDEEIITDENVIKGILESYYSSKYFPNGINLSSVYNDLMEFNKSRNQDYHYSIRDFTAHTPEKSCTHSLGFVNTLGKTDLNACYDNQSCYDLALSIAMRFEGKKIDYDDVPYFARVILDYRNDIVCIMQ